MFIKTNTYNQDPFEMYHLVTVEGKRLKARSGHRNDDGTFTLILEEVKERE